VNLRASQHMINVPVNKSIFNGYGGRQFSLADSKRQPATKALFCEFIPMVTIGEMGIGKNMMRSIRNAFW